MHEQGEGGVEGGGVGKEQWSVISGQLQARDAVSRFGHDEMSSDAGHTHVAENNCIVEE